MADSMEKTKKTKLKETLENLQEALEEFEAIPDEAKLEEFLKKTRAALNRLNQQLVDLDF